MADDPAELLRRQGEALPPGTLHPADLLTAPEPLGGLLRALLKAPATPAELAGAFGGEEAARAWAEAMAARGVLAADGGEYRLAVCARGRRAGLAGP